LERSRAASREQSSDAPPFEVESISPARVNLGPPRHCGRGWSGGEGAEEGEVRTNKYDREKIFKRDGGICQVCGADIRKIEHENRLPPMSFYECGHIVDQFISHDDSDGNLLCMCLVCNRFKPPHRTKQEFQDWLDAGGWVEPWIEKLKSKEESIITKDSELRKLAISTAVQYFIFSHFNGNDD
jgi:hypothetical protein